MVCVLSVWNIEKLAMSISSSSKIEVIVPDEALNTRQGLPSLKVSQQRCIEVESEILRENLRSIVANLQDALDVPEKTASCYQLEEIEFALELTAKGTFAFVAGIEGGAHASVKIKLKRRETK